MAPLIEESRKQAGLPSAKELGLSPKVHRPAALPLHAPLKLRASLLRQPFSEAVPTVLDSVDGKPS